MLFLSASLSLAVLAPGQASSLAPAQPVRDYSPFFAECRAEECGKRLIVLRTFRQAGEKRVLAVDPQTLQTVVRPLAGLHLRRAPWKTLRDSAAGEPYGGALQDSETRGAARQDAGIVHALPAGHGVVLTVDLCPSTRPLDRRLFEAVIAAFRPEERPVPLGLAVTGRWMEKHADDLAWLGRLESSGDIAVTWINHSYRHRYARDLPMSRNFLLEPGTDMRREILLTEALMLESGLRPSIFFRFPGLVSDRDLVGRVVAYGLVPIGSDAWLAKNAKNESPAPGSIVLVHGNGNEPLGVERFLALLRQEKAEIRSRNWLLFDLRESVMLEERAGNRAPPPSAAPPGGADAPLTVGTAVAERGRAVYGEIRVPEGKDASVSIAVAVVRGLRPGPVLALMAGSHGTEYASIVALSRLIPRLDPRTLSGSVIVAPLVNPASFEQMALHVNPVDGNSLFGPAPDRSGTQSQRILAALADQVVRPADVVVDLHGGDLDEDARAFTLWLRGGEAAQDAASLKLALAFGLDHIQIRDIDAADPGERRALPGYALGLGKTVLLAAVGRSGLVLPEDLTTLEEGLLNLLGSLGMVPRTVRGIEHPVFLDSGHRVLAEGAGLFFPIAARGARVSEGVKVGYTTDYLGRATGDIRSPASGLVNYVRGVPSMEKGATLIMVSSVLSEAPPYVKPAH